MFVVIQKLKLKKQNTRGDYKKYRVTSITFAIGGVTKTSYSYNPDYEAGRFEREHQEAFKISIHQSYRDDGKVKKIQCVLGTIGYYDLAGDWGLYDFIESGLNHAAQMFGMPDGLYDLVEAKVVPLRKVIQKEYCKTEEYKTICDRKKVQEEYRKAKAAFSKKYHVSENEFDYCFDVFGHVMNQEYLDEIIRSAKAYGSYGSYSDCSSGNYSDTTGRSDYSSYFETKSSTYTVEEKQTLKRFYKALSMKFHPDMNPDSDTTKEMQLLNKLSDEWGL